METGTNSKENKTLQLIPNQFIKENLEQLIKIRNDIRSLKKRRDESKMQKYFMSEHYELERKKRKKSKKIFFVHLTGNGDRISNCNNEFEKSIQAGNVELDSENMKTKVKYVDKCIQTCPLSIKENSKLQTNALREQTLKYLQKRFEKLTMKKAKKESITPKLITPIFRNPNPIEAQSTLQLLPENERLEYLDAAQSKYQELTEELNTLPVINKSRSKQIYKIEIEKNLQQLDDVIRTFRNPEVFVNTTSVNNLLSLI